MLPSASQPATVSLRDCDKAVVNNWRSSLRSRFEGCTMGLLKCWSVTFSRKSQVRVRFNVLKIFASHDVDEGSSQSIESESVEEHSGEDCEPRVEKPPWSSSLMFSRDPRTSFGELLTTPMAIALRKSLPIAMQWCDWHLIYSPTLDGISMQTFYRKQRGANLLVIQDTSGGIFGCVCREPWHLNLHRYGSFESLAFRIRSADEHTKFQLDVFPCASGTGMFQQGTPTQYCLDTALIVEEDLFHGASFKSQYYGTDESLSPMGEYFNIHHIECWSLQLRGSSPEEYTPDTVEVDLFRRRFKTASRVSAKPPTTDKPESSWLHRRNSI